MLPGAVGSEPQAILAIAPHAPCEARSSGECTDRDNRDRNGHAVRLLAIRTVCRRIQIALRRTALGHACALSRGGGSPAAVVLGFRVCRRRLGLIGCRSAGFKEQSSTPS